MGLIEEADVLEVVEVPEMDGQPGTDDMLNEDGVLEY